MRRYTIALLISILSLLLSASASVAETDIISYEPLSLVFTVDNAVYSGFTNQLVQTTLKPTDLPKVSEDSNQFSNVYFEYDSDQKEFFVNNIYYYVQVFKTSPVTINIRSAALSPATTGGNIQSISWESIGEHSASVTSGTSNIDSTGGNFTINESSQDISNWSNPRVYSGEVNIRIPADSVNMDAGSYSTTITLEVVSQ